MADIVIDASEVARLARDITTTGKTIPQAIRPVMEKAGVQIKAKGKEEASGRKHAPRLGAAWSYDIKQTPLSTEITAGPRTGAAGSLAFYYFGNSKIGPSLPDPVHIVEEEADVVAAWLAEVGTQALRMLG